MIYIQVSYSEKGLTTADNVMKKITTFPIPARALVTAGLLALSPLAQALMTETRVADAPFADPARFARELPDLGSSSTGSDQALEKRNNFSKDIGLPGLADAHIVLTRLASQIGREEPNKIVLSGDAALDMTSLFGNQKADITLKLKAQPVFNKEKGAIYLQDMDIVDATVKPEKMQSAVKSVLPWLNQSLRDYFNKNPAYVLSEDRSEGEALAKKHATGIEVKPGEIVIPFSL